VSLAPERLERFARHIVLPEVGGAGQAALAGRHVALIGLGGIGSPALQYLAGAGVGRFTLVDSGDVELSNLQRQTIYTTRDIGHAKAVAARRWLANFDGAIPAEVRDDRIDSHNAGALIANADLVLDGTDNFATRLAVSDACVAAVAARAEPAVFILWGSHAQKKASRIAELNEPTRHCVIRSPHPSPLSAHRGFFGSKPFSRANEFLQSVGRDPVDWSLA